MDERGESSSTRISAFQPQEDDDENLWPIEGILAENKKKYKVRWAGLDPKTGKPWPDQWVPKADVTDDVVDEWDALTDEQREERNNEQDAIDKEAKKKTKTRKSSTKGISKSTASKTRASTTTSSPKKGEANRKPAESISNQRVVVPKLEPVTVVLPKAPTRGKKRGHEDDETEVSELSKSVPDALKATKPKSSNKKRKVAHPPTEPAQKAKSRRRTKQKTVETFTPNQDYETSEDEVEAVISPDKQPKKNIHAEATKRKPVVKSKHIPPESDDDEPESRKALAKRVFKSKAFVESDDEPISTPPKPPSKKVSKPRKKKTNPNRNAPVSSDEEEQVHEPNGRTANGRPDASLSLSPAAQRRLEEFDAEIGVVRDHETEPSEHSINGPGLAYGESDVDSMAVDLLYPNEEDIAGPPSSRRRKGKNPGIIIEIEDEDDDVPETQSLQDMDERPPPLLSTPSRSSMISKMKPRTPHTTGGSKLSVLDHDFDLPLGDIVGKSPPRPVASKQPKKGTKKPSKPLQQLPVVSPSRFQGLLPSSLNLSTIENPEDSHRHPPSSAEQIEDFDSPAKPRNQPIRATIFSINPRPATAGVKAKATKPIDPEQARLEKIEKAKEYWSYDAIQARGKQMNEKSRLEKLKEQGGSKAPRRNLEDIRRHKPPSTSKSPVEPQPARSRSAKSPSLSPSPAPASSPPPQQVDEDMDYEDDNGGLEYVDEPDYVPQPHTNDETQDDYDVDMGGAGHHLQIRAIPEEEEESTQDLLHEREVEKAISIAGSPEPEPVPQEEEEEEEEEEQVTQNETQNVSMDPQPGTQQRDEFPELEHPAPSLARGRSKTSNSSKLQIQEDSQQEIPPTAPTHQDSTQDTTTSTDSNGPKDLKDAMSLLHVKSEEISRLEQSLLAERAKVEDLYKEIETYKIDIANSTQSIQQLSSSTDLVAQIQSELATAKTVHADDLRKWEEEKYRLELSVKVANDRKDLADRETASFREQYIKAYSSLGALQAEKKELEKELVITQKQAKDGVAGIRTMFDQKLQTLEKEKAMWQHHAKWAIDMEHRTNGDIRRRAAEEPEAKAKYHKYKERCVGLEEKIRSLQEGIEDKDAEVASLEGNLEDRRRENHGLRLAVKNLTAQLLQHQEPHSQSPMQSQSNGNGSVNGYGSVHDSQDPEAEVYRCQWRLTEGNFCNHLCSSQEDLQSHMISSLHIPTSADTLD